jgi:hypothetical protein
VDGFGLIAFASLFPIISVMTYAQLSEWRARMALAKNADKSKPDNEEHSQGEQ